jgi:hypothetical protein
MSVFRRDPDAFCGRKSNVHRSLTWLKLGIDANVGSIVISEFAVRVASEM